MNPQALADAQHDTSSYLARVSVSSPVVAGNPSPATIPKPQEVRAVIAAIYDAVGRSNLVEAWFMTTDHNRLNGTTLPAFTSATLNGTLSGSSVPTMNASGMTFTAATPNCVLIPSAIDADLLNFTDIAICQSVGNNVSRGICGNHAQDPSGGGGYVLDNRYSSTPIQRVLGLSDWGGVNEANGGSLYGAPMRDYGQCVAASLAAGTQRVYRDGMLIAGGTQATIAVNTINRQFAIGAEGKRIDGGIQGGFNGTISFLCKLRGTPSPGVMARLMSDLRLILSPRGKINAVGMGDSRTIGMDYSGTAAVFTSQADPNAAYLYQLAGKSNWSMASAFALGTSSDTAANAVASNEYEAKGFAKYITGSQRAYVFIWFGINDFIQTSATAAEVYQNINRLCGQVISDGGIAVVIGQPPSSGSNDTKCLALNALLAASPPGDYYLPIYNEFPVGSLYDGIHLTDAGNDHLADLINSLIPVP